MIRSRLLIGWLMLTASQAAAFDDACGSTRWFGDDLYHVRPAADLGQGLVAQVESLHLDGAGVKLVSYTQCATNRSIRATYARWNAGEHEPATPSFDVVASAMASEQAYTMPELAELLHDAGVEADFVFLSAPSCGYQQFYPDLVERSTYGAMP